MAAETAWSVSVSVWGLQLHLHLTSRIPAAFSAALCQRRGGQCEPEAPLYTVTQVSAAGLGGRGGDRPALTLPLYFAARGLCSRGVGTAAARAGPGQLCGGKATLVQSSVLWGTQHGPPLTQPLPQVWRSDVHFARKQLLCPDGERGSWRGLRGQWKWADSPFTAPLPVSRRHFGLLGLVLALGLVVTVLLLNCCGAWRPNDGKEHPRGLECQGVSVPGLQGVPGW